MSNFETVLQMKKMLSNLDRWLEKAAAHADAKKFDVNILANARLAPDMYPFTKQVQSACDSAKFAGARLTGKDAPSHPDTETTIPQLRERIGKVVAFLDTLKSNDFEGSDQRKVTVSYMPGKFIYGSDYLGQTALPNFYFHVTTAYAILRHNGVDVGKMDYIGAAPFHDAK
jgi:uncharacterized protein